MYCIFRYFQAQLLSQTVAYLERVPEVAEPAGIALRALGDGNWRMGEGVAVAKGPQLNEGGEEQILQHYLRKWTFFYSLLTCSLVRSDDVVTATLASLTTLARSSRRPAFGAIFLLNNVFYLHSHLLESSESAIASILAKPTRDALQSASRTAKAGYFDSNFSPLMENLIDSRDKSKTSVKDKFTRFFDQLDEVNERHKMAKVLEDDDEARETLSEEVVKLVVPSFQRFTQKTKEKEFSKSESIRIVFSSLADILSVRPPKM